MTVELDDPASDVAMGCSLLIFLLVAVAVTRIKVIMILR